MHELLRLRVALSQCFYDALKMEHFLMVAMKLHVSSEFLFHIKKYASLQLSGVRTLHAIKLTL